MNGPSFKPILGRARESLWNLALFGIPASSPPLRAGYGPSLASLAARLRLASLLPARVAILRLLLPGRFVELSLPELLERLSRSTTRRADAKELSEIHHITEELLRHNRWLRTTCLYRSLVRYALLRRAGVDVTFAMGVAEQGSELIGHAWLELEHQPYMEEMTHAYAKTFEYP